MKYQQCFCSYHFVSIKNLHSFYKVVITLIVDLNYINIIMYNISLRLIKIIVNVKIKLNSTLKISKDNNLQAIFFKMQVLDAYVCTFVFIF